MKQIKDTKGKQIHFILKVDQAFADRFQKYIDEHGVKKQFIAIKAIREFLDREETNKLKLVF